MTDVDHTDFWPDHLAAQEVDPDAAILAAAEEGRAGIECEVRNRVYGWIAAVVLAVFLAGAFAMWLAAA